ncbi:MAG: glycosyltransferase, partial [Alphaproteobacteria bacterium]
TKYLERVYLDSGIPQEKLRLVPLGIDPEVFRPDVPPYVFTVEAGAQYLQDAGAKAGSLSKEGQATRPFTFLFVGGSIHRKGIDILLEAYRRAFTSLDDVCLIIKDTGTSTVYRDANSRDSILERINDPQHPAMVYLDNDMDSPQLAGLFAGADCYVQPYRGEGFCLPVLESMACGTPVVVPRGGPTDDFVDESVGWLLEAEHKPFHVDDAGKGHVGPWECVGPTWQFEVDPNVLARLMRRIAFEADSQREEVQRKGVAAAERAHSQWTWRQAAEKARLTLSEFAVSEFAVKAEEVQSSTESNQKDALEEEAVDSLVGLSDETAQTGPVPSEVGRSKPRLSLCMIVKNEERVFGDCLRSASPWFDEVIVVDTGSTDATVAIAEELGAKVFNFPWCDDFSAARNVSLEHATGDWLFWMDADDTLPEECGRELRRLAELAEDRVSGFIVPVHIPPAKGETGFTIVDHVKLFRNHPGHRFEGRIHEQILGPIHRTGGTIERSSAYVVHSGYDYSPAGQVHKRERDIRILEKDLADRPDHPFVLFNIGMTGYHMKDYDKAILTLLR